MPKKKKGKGDDDGTFEVESFDGDKLDEVISSAGTLNPAALGGLDPEALSPRKGGKTNIVIIGNPLEEPEHEPEPKVNEDREGEEHDDWWTVHVGLMQKILVMKLKHFYFVYAVAGAVVVAFAILAKIYSSVIPGSVTTLAILAGLFMGGLFKVAYEGLVDKDSKKMQKVQAANIMIMLGFVWIFCVTIIFVFDARDPIRTAVNEGWGVGARDQLEATSFCRLHGGGPCAVFYRAVDACAAGNCSGSGSCARSWIDTPRQDSSNCSVLAVSAQSECKRMAPSCEECDQACKQEFMASLKANLDPIVIGAHFMLLVVLVTILMNEYVLATKPDVFTCCAPDSIDEGSAVHPDTPWITIDALDSSNKDDNGADDIEQTAGSTQIITYLLNLGVMLVGVMVLTTGISIQAEAMKHCPEGMECIASGTNGAVVVGLVVVTVGVLNLVGSKLVFGHDKKSNVMMGLYFMKLAQLAYGILLVMLVIACILLQLADGWVDDLHKGFAEDWPEHRREAEENNPEFCAGLSDTLCMTKYEEEGRTAVRTQLELVVFIALGFISFVMVTAYFTHHVIRDFKLLAGITGRKATIRWVFTCVDFQLTVDYTGHQCPKVKSACKRAQPWSTICTWMEVRNRIFAWSQGALMPKHITIKPIKPKKAKAPPAQP